MSNIILQPPALPHRHRLHGQSDDRQQRRDLRLGDVRADEGRRVVQEHRHREIDRAQAVQRFRRLRPARRVRVSHGDHGGRTAEGGRRRGCEGGADRRGRRAVRPGLAIRADHRLRRHHYGRVGHRARPAARLAPRIAEFSRVLHRGVVRPMHAVPRGHPQALGRRGAPAARALFDGLSQGALRPGRNHATGVEVRFGPVGPQRPAIDRQTLPGRDLRPRAGSSKALARRTGGGRGAYNGQ